MSRAKNALTLMKKGSGAVLTRLLGTVGGGVSELAVRLGPEAQQAVLRPLVERLVYDHAGLRVTFEKVWHHADPLGHAGSAPGPWVSQSALSLPGSEPTAPPPGVLHLTRVVEQRMAQIERCKPFEQSEDPVEAIHQLRVASRRLQAFVHLFAPFVHESPAKWLRKPLRRITRAAGDLRNTDVQLARIEKQSLTAGSEVERAALGHLLQRLRKRHGKLRRRATAALERVDIRALRGPVRQMLDQLACRAQAPSMTYDLLAELAFQPVAGATRDAHRRVAHSEKPAELHTLRLAVKRLRYSAELLQPALGVAYHDVYEKAERLQDLLGEHQDLAVFEALLQAHREKARRRGDTHLLAGLQALAERATSERGGLLAQCRADAAELMRTLG